MRAGGRAEGRETAQRLRRACPQAVAERVSTESEDGGTGCSGADREVGGADEDEPQWLRQAEEALNRLGGHVAQLPLAGHSGGRQRRSRRERRQEQRQKWLKGWGAEEEARWRRRYDECAAAAMERRAVRAALRIQAAYRAWAAQGRVLVWKVECGLQTRRTAGEIMGEQGRGTELHAALLSAVATLQAEGGGWGGRLRQGAADCTVLMGRGVPAVVRERSVSERGLSLGRRLRLRRRMRLSGAGEDAGASGAGQRIREPATAAEGIKGGEKDWGLQSGAVDCAGQEEGRRCGPLSGTQSELKQSGAAGSRLQVETVDCGRQVEEQMGRPELSGGHLKSWSRNFEKENRRIKRELQELLRELGAADCDGGSRVAVDCPEAVDCALLSRRGGRACALGGGRLCGS